MNIVKKGFYYIHEFLVFVAKIMLIAMVCIVTVQVFCRKFLDFSIKWSEEVPLILMVWFGFISMAIGVKKKLHISIEIFYSMFPKKMQIVVGKIVTLLVVIMGMCMMYYGFQLSKFTMTSTLAATKLPTGYLYAVIPLAGLLITYDSVMDLLGIEKIEKEESEIDKILKGGDH